MNERQRRNWDAALQLQASLRDDAARPEGAWLTVVGDSMLPTLAPGARVCVRANRPVHVGDVIAFATADGSRCVLHRVLFCLPRVPWILQAGDCQREQPSVGVIHRRQLIGVADLPRRAPSGAQLRGMLRTLAAAVLR
jgi:hypothetical protein